MKVRNYTFPKERLNDVKWAGSLLRYNPGKFILVELTEETVTLDDIPINTILCVRKDTLLFDKLHKEILYNNMKIGELFKIWFVGNRYPVEIEHDFIARLNVFVLKDESHRAKILKVIDDLNTKLGDASTPKAAYNAIKLYSTI